MFLRILLRKNHWSCSDCNINKVLFITDSMELYLWHSGPCIHLYFFNTAGITYMLYSTLKPEGYLVQDKVFRLRYIIRDTRLELTSQSDPDLNSVRMYVTLTRHTNTICHSGFAYLTIKNNNFLRFARAFFIFFFADVLVLSTTWNDLFFSCVEDVSIWW